MRQESYTFAGLGELLCIVLAWTVGIAAIWSDATRDAANLSGGKVADGGGRSSAVSYYD